MTRLIEALLSFLTIPVMIMNIAGGITGGVWLISIGDWKVLLGCLIFAIFGNYLLMFPILLSAIFALPAESAIKRGWHKTSAFLACLSGLYTVCLMTLWACGSLYYLIQISEGNSILPYLLCSYGVATTPWSQMAQQESSGQAGFNPAMTLAGFLSMSYVVAIAATMLGFTFGSSVIIIAGALLIGLGMNLKLASDIQKAQQRYGLY